MPQSNNTSDPMLEHVMSDLVRYANFLSDDANQSMDLVQESCRRFLSSQITNPSIARPKKYIFSIMYNLHCDRMRLKQKNDVLVELDGQELPDEQSSPILQLTYKEVLAQIEKLPETQQNVLKYLIDEDLSYSEIGNALNIPAGTVMSRLYRARRALRIALDIGDDDNLDDLFDDCA